MVRVKKSSDSGGAPSLDILAAKLRVIEVEFNPEPYEVEPENGTPFTSDPNLNLKIEVVKNLVEPGKDEGATFYDRFKLKQDKNGDWVFAAYSKLGNLVIVRYGEGWFDDPAAEFKEEDFEDFEFIAQVEPKQDRNGKPIPGSTVNWKGMRPAGGADEREAEEVKATAQAEEETDFDDIPF